MKPKISATAAFLAGAAVLFLVACQPASSPPELAWPEMAQCLNKFLHNGGDTDRGLNAAPAQIWCATLLVKDQPRQHANRTEFRRCEQPQRHAYHIAYPGQPREFAETYSRWACYRAPGLRAAEPDHKNGNDHPQ